MELSNSAFDLASLREEQEREAAVDAARASLKTRGSFDCTECGRPIPEQRRRAAPFAVRCIECQTIHEQEKYHR
jgi:phage/conjugal plasmid C-4 type zinc finger TraR family protein